MCAHCGTYWPEDGADCQTCVLSWKVARVTPGTLPLGKMPFNIHRQERELQICELTRPESTCWLSDHPSTKNTKGGIQTSLSRKQQPRGRRTEYDSVLVLSNRDCASGRIMLWLCQPLKNRLQLIFQLEILLSYLVLSARHSELGSGKHLVCDIRGDLLQCSQTEKNGLSLSELLRFLWIKKTKKSNTVYNQFMHRHIPRCSFGSSSINCAQHPAPPTM